MAKREGLSEGEIDRISLYESSDFSERTKAALRFADRFAENHRSIDDEYFADLRDNFSDAEIVELGLTVGTFLSLGRLIHILDLHYGPDPAARP